MQLFARARYMSTILESILIPPRLSHDFNNFSRFSEGSHVVHMFFPVPKDFPMDFSTPAAPQSPLLPWHQRPARLRRLSGATTSCCGPPWCLRWKSDGFVSRFFGHANILIDFPYIGFVQHLEIFHQQRLGSNHQLLGF